MAFAKNIHEKMTMMGPMHFSFNAHHRINILTQTTMNTVAKICL